MGKEGVRLIRGRESKQNRELCGVWEGGGGKDAWVGVWGGRGPGGVYVCVSKSFGRVVAGKVIEGSIACKNASGRENVRFVAVRRRTCGDGHGKLYEKKRVVL